ncbi:MAG: hypothetical protein ACLPQ0_11535 [Candidatus Binatus sp.]
MAGRGMYYGELRVDSSGDEFNTDVHLTSVDDGSKIVRFGRGAIYGGYAWRGRSQGAQPMSSAPDDPNSVAREVLWIAPDQSTAEGLSRCSMNAWVSQGTASGTRVCFLSTPGPNGSP